MCQAKFLERGVRAASASFRHLDFAECGHLQHSNQRMRKGPSVGSRLQLAGADAEDGDSPGYRYLEHVPCCV